MLMIMIVMMVFVTVAVIMMIFFEEGPRNDESHDFVCAF